MDRLKLQAKSCTYESFFALSALFPGVLQVVTAYYPKSKRSLTANDDMEIDMDGEFQCNASGKPQVTNTQNHNSIQFFRKVHNKMHFAAHGNTAAELVYGRADGDKPFSEKYRGYAKRA